MKGAAPRFLCDKAEARHAARVRRELGAWPRGPAGGFEPLGEVVKRLVKNLAPANGSRYNHDAAPGGVDAPAEGLTDDAAR